MSDRDRLTRGMMRAIPALLQTVTIEAAAEMAGLSEATIYRYLRDPAFQRELRKRQDAILSGTVATLVGRTGAVLSELYAIAMGAGKASVRTQACRAWLKHTRDSLQLRDVVERVAAIEEVLDDAKT